MTLLALYAILLTASAPASVLSPPSPATAAPRQGTAEPAIAELVELGRTQKSQGEYGASRASFARALERLHALSEGPGRLGTEALIGLAEADLELGHLSEAQGELESAGDAALSAGQKDDRLIVTISNDLAVLATRQGRFPEAEGYFRSAIELASARLGAVDPATVAAQNGLASLYMREGRVDEAQAILKRVAQSSPGEKGDPSDAIVTRNGLAMTYFEKGEFAKAQEMLEREAAAASRSLGEEHPMTLVVLNNLAETYRRQGRLVDAEAMLHKVLEIRQRRLGNSHSQTIVSTVNLGEIEFAQGRRDEADRLLESALSESQASLGADHPYTLAAASVVAADRLADPGRAASALRPARLLVAGLRSRGRLGLDIRLTGNAFGASAAEREKMFALLADADWAALEEDSLDRTEATAEAFAALQSASAGPAATAVAAMAARRLDHAGDTRLPSLARERQDIDARLVQLDAVYDAALGGEAAADAGKRRDAFLQRTALERRRNELDDLLRAEFPAYTALVRPSPLAPDTVQRLLRPDEALLLLVPDARATHVIAVSGDGVLWRRSPVTRAQVAASVRLLLWSVGAPISATSSEAAELDRMTGSGFPRAEAYALHQAIIAPVATALKGKRHVFVVTSGPLTSLPLGILVSASPSGRDDDPASLRATHWLADEHALSVLPSVQALQLLRSEEQAKRAQRSSSFFGIGDPVLDGAPASPGRGPNRSGEADLKRLFGDPARGVSSAVADTRQLSKLARLPGTAAELEAMQAALGQDRGELLLGTQATEMAVKKTDLSRKGIIAFATHGLVAGDISEPAEPGLVLTPPAVPSAADDGYLTSSEVASLRIGADWVILSACNTAAADANEGAPGLSGLARSFFYAGARRLLVSHWPLRDDVAAELTVQTLALLKANTALTPDEALQRAMRAVRENQAHDKEAIGWADPLVWAPFSIVGDGAMR